MDAYLILIIVSGLLALLVSGANMANATNAIFQIDGDPKYIVAPVLAGAKLVPGGGVIVVTATGFADNPSDAAGRQTLGIVEPAGQGDEDVDNTTGANGAITVRVRTRGLVKMIATAVPDQSWLGRAVYWDFNNAVDLIGGVANNILAGYVTSFDTAAQTVEFELAGLGRLVA